jgi:serine/threonine protein kinase
MDAFMPPNLLRLAAQWQHVLDALGASVPVATLPRGQPSVDGARRWHNRRAMSDPTSPEERTLQIPQGEGSGGRIGPFRILQQIGEGGFGSVFEAEQEHPVKRRVALKIIKLGMDTREVITRFEAERQALALMDHPNIARVLDAGATMSGRPYFVMELVRGEPISAYCIRHGLSIAQRLQLFDQVCAAVQHAHTKGIIHRDLKPNNVLVSTQDDEPFAKVIDFGIAKATSGRLTDKTMYTEANLMMGTPLYMSPEQAEGSADIDTRTDIYALGVILYELLTDTTPINSDTLRTAGYAEVQRIIREVEPPRPSVRLLKSFTTKIGLAAKNKVEPRKLAGMLRGELDWIVMKAIEKDRARRYETANALATDLRRYLSGEAVLAAPPGATYRLQKFVRRHKATVAAGAMVTTALVVGIVGFAWQARIAKARADELEQVSKFQEAMLGQVDPTKAGELLSSDVQAKFAAALVRQGMPEPERAAQIAAFGNLWKLVNTTDTARDLIDRTILKPAVLGIDKQFKNQPLVDASLRQVLAKRYADMGLLEEALPLQRRALDTRRRLLGADAVDTLVSLQDMGILIMSMGKLAESESYMRETLVRMRRVLGEDNPRTLDVLSNLSLLLAEENKLREAEPYAREALATRRRVLGDDASDTLESILNVGVLLQEENKLSEAEPFMRDASERMRRVHGENDPTALLALGNLGDLLEDEGKLAEAEPIDRDFLARIRRVLGEDNQTTLLGVNLLGGLLEKRGKHDEAATLLAPSEPAERKAFISDNAYRIGEFLLPLGKARSALGDYANAQANLLEAQRIFDRTVNPTRARDLRNCTQALVALYTAWNAAAPGNGYDAQAATWKRKLGAPEASIPAAATPR